jgi:hypothetical protein
LFPWPSFVSRCVVRFDNLNIGYKNNIVNQTQEARTASLEHLLAEARTKRAKAFMAQDRRAVDAWDREITRLWQRTQGKAGALL